MSRNFWNKNSICKDKKQRCQEAQKITFAIQGGLGNQLFQWFYAHSFIQNQSIDTQVTFDPLFEGNAESRNFELLRVVEKCKHFGFEKDFVSKGIKIKLFHLMNYLWQFRVLHSLLNRLGYWREDPREDQPQGVRENQIPVYSHGYFQDYSYFGAIKKIIDAELVNEIADESAKVRERLELVGEYCVLHVRRGDYFSEERSSVYLGMLADEYYTEWLAQHRKGEVVILTEDRAECPQLLEAVGCSKLFDKRDTSSWDVLSIMFGAEAVLSSNSTLSWWGSWLCSLNRGQVWLPSEWSEWGNVDVKKFHFESAKLFPVKWINA